MKREQLIRVGSHVAVAAFAAWLLRQLGLKQGTIAAFAIVALAHEILDAPLARAVEDVV